MTVAASAHLEHHALVPGRERGQLPDPSLRLRMLTVAGTPASDDREDRMGLAMFAQQMRAA
ncbi:MAG TPA: hypothetical protein VM052_08840 [Candidatus Limnocylindrales bacterium]|nr:hypothetical protein [Candidatus Limnocylindrales bacterium]